MTDLVPQSRPTRRRGVGLAAAGLALALLLGACGPGANGIQKETGPAIIKAAGKALSRAHQFQISENLTSQGHTESLIFNVAGPNQGEGTFSTSGLSFQAEELDGVDYFRSKNLWSQVGGTSLQQALGDQWVFAAASSPTAAQLSAAFAGLTSAKSLAAQLTAGAKGAVRGKVSSLDGSSVVAVAEASAGTVYVATHGTPYPLRWDHGSEGSAEFRDFGRHFKLKKPKKPVSLAAIMGG